MDGKNELTVIISNYNQERHLAETIDSALAQVVDFQLKIIITDDHSCIDHSREIIESYAEKYDNIETIFGYRNEGYLVNIMRAEERMDTEFFCLLDADDYWTDMHFLQRAYDFLKAHMEYSIYESNVEVFNESCGNKHPFVSRRIKSGTFSKEMFLRNQAVPVTQTTGMVLRNCIFDKGIPDIMKRAVGTRSEKSFEGDTGRFIMHLKEGFAYYDDRVVGVYRITGDGIWNSLSEAEKRIITARMQMDYYQYYGSEATVFVNRAYKAFQRYFAEKQKEFVDLKRDGAFFDDEERLMAEDVYRFCKEHENEIFRDNGLYEKARQIYRILRS